MKIIHFIVLLLALLFSPAFATVALDGHASNFNNGGGTTGTVTLTTTANDLVVVCASLYGNTSTVPTVSSISSSHLSSGSWTKRSSVSGLYVSGNGADLECWWAHAASALSAEVITVTGTGASDTMSIFALAFSGANTSSPFDGNVSLPATNSNLTATSSDVTLSSVSTTSAAGMLFSAFTSLANISGLLPLAAPTNFTNLDTVSGSGSSTYNDGQDATFSYAAAQSSITISYGGGVSPSPRWLAVADAIVPSGAVASPPTRTLLGVGK